MLGIGSEGEQELTNIHHHYVPEEACHCTGRNEQKNNHCFTCELTQIHTLV